MEILASDVSGNRLSVHEVRLRHLESGKVRTEQSARLTDVSYGEYEVSVYAQGFRKARRLLSVRQENTLVRVPLDLVSLACEEPLTTLSGKVTGMSPNVELWVKVISALGFVGGEGKVGPYGYFQVSGLSPGANVILVMQGKDVLATLSVKDIRQPVEIPLRSLPAGVQ